MIVIDFRASDALFVDKTMRTALREIDPYVSPDLASQAAADVLSQRAGDCISTELADALATDDPVLLRGLPVGEIGSTPADGARPMNRKDRVSEGVMLGVAQLLALQPVSYQTEKNGDVIHQICPVKGFESSKSNRGSDNFAFHIEAPHDADPPDYLMLLCLRGNPQAVTIIAPMTSILRRAPEWVLEQLAEPCFQLRLGESFGSRALALVRVLEKDQSPKLRLDLEEMRPTTPKSIEALKWVEAELNQRHIEHVLAPGEMLFWNNRTVVHGRKGFPVTYDGTQRWLQRMYLRRTFPERRRADPTRPWVIDG